jgi:protein subunit release factor B
MFSVGIKDCEVQTFRAGGPGGQNQNKRDTGVRVIHHPSGAVGESRDERTQLKNKKNAFRRMVESKPFMAWVKMQTSKDEHLKAEVERDMFPNKIKVETFKDGKWVEE